jgi:hypothetical protein
MIPSAFKPARLRLVKLLEQDERTRRMAARFYRELDRLRTHQTA